VAIKGVQRTPLLHRFINKSAYPRRNELCRNLNDQDVILLEDVYPSSQLTALAQSYYLSNCGYRIQVLQDLLNILLDILPFFNCSRTRKVYLPVDACRIEDIIRMAAAWYIKCPTLRISEIE